MELEGQEVCVCVKRWYVGKYGTGKMQHITTKADRRDEQTLPHSQAHCEGRDAQGGEEQDVP